MAVLVGASYLSEGRQWLKEALSWTPQEGSKACGKVFNGAATLALDQGDLGAARSLSEQGLALFRKMKDKEGIADALHNLGEVALDQGDYSAARPFFEQSLAIRQELGEKWGIARSLCRLGIVAYRQGDYTAAGSLFEQSLAIRREMGYKVGIAESLHNLGNAALAWGDYTAARSFYEETLAICWEIKDKFGIASCLWALAATDAAEGRFERSAQLLGAAEALFQLINAHPRAFDYSEYKNKVAVACAQLDEAVFAKARAEGRAMTLEQAIEYALKRTF